jgi:hypothetical protein
MYSLSDLPQRIANKIDRSATTGCWLWTAYTNRDGYGVAIWGSRTRKDRASKLVHRLVYELLVKPIAHGLELDHKCRVRNCVNPEHLEEVSHRENVIRGTFPEISRRLHAAITHCPQGHEYNEENTRIGQFLGYRTRQCRVCDRERQKAKRRARAA